MHVRVRVHQQQRPAHWHVRGRVHVRQLLRAQPDHGAAGHVAGLLGTGGAVHAARRRWRVTAASSRAPTSPSPPATEPSQAAQAVAGDGAAVVRRWWCRRTGR